jgi:membrane protein implicated in regulation of membrane protease activity
MEINTLTIIWFAAAIVLGAVEAFTVGLTCIWFAIGAVVAAVLSIFDVRFPIQVIIFLMASLVLVIFARPILTEKLKVGKEKNVTNQIEEKIGVVTESITPFASGLVKVNGVIWSAICENPDATIPQGIRVRVVRIEGVKLIVEPDAPAQPPKSPIVLSDFEMEQVEQFEAQSQSETESSEPYNYQ